MSVVRLLKDNVKEIIGKENSDRIYEIMHARKRPDHHHGNAHPRQKVESCNLCNSKNRTVLYSKATPMGDLCSVMCNECATIYLSERVVDEWLEAGGKHGGAYGHAEELTLDRLQIAYDVDYGYAKKTCAFLTDFIKLPENAVGLDISAGVGGTAKAIEDELGISMIGLEASQKLSQYAREHKNVDVRCEHIADYEPGQKFDLITGIRMINHYADPKAVFEKIESILKPGGYLFLTTKDVYHDMARKGAEKCIEPDHPFMFSAHSLKLYHESVGLQVVKTLRDQDKQHDFGTLNHVHTLAQNVKNVVAFQKNELAVNRELMTYIINDLK